MSDQTVKTEEQSDQDLICHSICIFCRHYSEVEFEPRFEKNQSSGFPTRSHTNRAVQPQKMARGLKFCILEEEELYYLCSENKCADQLLGYR